MACTSDLVWAITSATFNEKSQPLRETRLGNLKLKRAINLASEFSGKDPSFVELNRLSIQ
jgi:hypothetical protein